VAEPTGKWILNHGCHRGTITSRDVGQPEEFDTREDAVNALTAHRKWYKSIGYQIWFATLKSPEGKEETLESNPCY
jgi:hypothetical protein